MRNSKYEKYESTKKETLSFLNPKENGLVLVYFEDNHKFQQLQNKDLLELEIEN